MSTPPSHRVAVRRRRQLALTGGAMLTLTALFGAWQLSTVDDSSPELPATSVAELGRYEHHDAAVLALAVTVDGSQAVSGDQAGVVQLWDPKTREKLAELRGHRGAVNAVAIAPTPEPTLAATAGDDGTLRIWNLATRQEELQLEDETPTVVTSVAFYPAATHVLTGSRQGQIALWDLRARRVVRRFTSERVEITGLAITPDGQRFVATDSVGGVTWGRLIQTAGLRRMVVHSGGARALAIAASGGRAYTCGADGRVVAWDVETQRELSAWSSDGAVVDWRTIAVSPGGTRVVTGSASGVVRLWSTDAGQRLDDYLGHQAAVTAVCFQPTGIVAMSASADRSVRSWQLPPPSDSEPRGLAEARRRYEQRVELYRKFRQQMELARQSLASDHSSRALTEFQAAAELVAAGTLEHQLASEAADGLRANIAWLEKYQIAAKAGAEALEAGNLIAAQRELGVARVLAQAHPNAPNAAQVEAGYQTATVALEVEKLLASAEHDAPALDFVERALATEALQTSAAAPPKQDFACLLVDASVPMAPAATPLAWNVPIKLERGLPEVDVRLRVELRLVGAARPEAVSECPFATATAEQTLRGQLVPRGPGWRCGEYEVRSILVAPKPSVPASSNGAAKPRGPGDVTTRVLGEPQRFKLGLVHWQGKSVDLQPGKVQDSEYEIDTGLKIRAGDALFVRAEGTTTPAPTSFYRELMVDPKIAQPIPAKPEGLPWLNNELRAKKYRVVDIKSNFAAVLYRVGVEGPWLPHSEKTPKVPSPWTGTVRLTINSILPAIKGDGLKTPPPTKADRQFWSADSTSYTVRLWHGEFEFPEELTVYERGALLQRF